MNTTTTTTKLDILRDKIELIKSEYSDLDKIIDYVQRNGLLTTKKESNAKISKSNLSNEYRTASLSLLPARLSGFNVCPFHSHCVQDCIGVFSGRNIYPVAIKSKLIKTLLYFYDSELFIQILMREIGSFKKACKKSKLLPAIRLNTYSDILWERKFPIIFTENPSIQFYDYSKVYHRRFSWNPENYDLTYSGIASFHDNPEKLYQLAENSRVSIVVSNDIFNRYFSHISVGDYIDNLHVRFYNGDIDDMTFRYPNEKTVLVLKEKTRYKIDQNNLNPLVYRDTRMIGL